ncbi:SAM-dependent methyltransferase [Amycolatopsis alba]|uniref:S-adenosyl-L-methionine-dependent methyltransferase n=1 Tax=Amycolatopsis alba DSM 44262 TaxID=1125972 RepID=A0A229RL49_AMYAL|nr:SAM-dependent methyltransferase [Amycolatopsis alba]OXM47373.1 SAM-dependent methyltransferase [Amycolatopsis alba DSM 44262]
MVNTRGTDSRGVSATALTAAAARWAESHRKDRMLDDPLAGDFLAAAGWKTSERGPLAGVLGDMFAVRTRFLDKRLLRFVRHGGRQVVVLGAGLDTRAFRLDWPTGVTVFELDRPTLLRFKEATLAKGGRVPGCRRVVMDADLAEDWVPALVDAGLDPGEPVAWLVEGVLLYLSGEQGDRLIGALSELGGHGTVLLVEHMNRITQIEQPGCEVADQVASLGEPWLSHLDDPAGWLSRFGWESEVRDIRELAVSYGRPVPPIVDDEDLRGRMIWCVAAAHQGG